MMYFRGTNSLNGLRGCFGYGAGYMHGGQWLMMGLGVLLAAAVIVAVVLLFKKASHHQTADGTLDTLKIRYANGDITEEEYTKMKKILGK